MKCARLLAVLALCAFGSPLWAGTGNSPSDPVILKPSGEVTFKWWEASSPAPNDVTHEYWRVYSATDSTRVSVIEHVTTLVPGKEYVINDVVPGQPGAIVRLTVWSTDYATDSAPSASCSKWVMIGDSITSGGCACVAR